MTRNICGAYGPLEMERGMTRDDVFIVFSAADGGRPIVHVVATLVALKDFAWDDEVRSFRPRDIRIDLRHRAFACSLLDRGLVAPCRIRQIQIGQPGYLDDSAERRSTLVGGSGHLGTGEGPLVTLPCVSR